MEQGGERQRARQHEITNTLAVSLAVSRQRKQAIKNTRRQLRARRRRCEGEKGVCGCERVEKERDVRCERARGARRRGAREEWERAVGWSVVRVGFAE
eukprot:1303007-Rhodomonas_salina.1